VENCIIQMVCSSVAALGVYIVILLSHHLVLSRISSISTVLKKLDLRYELAKRGKRFTALTLVDMPHGHAAWTRSMDM
jgi:hypothetical protein